GGATGGLIFIWTMIGVFATDYVPWTAPASVALAVVVPIIFGLTERGRREKLTEFELSAERRQQAARIAAADAVRAERARIARELHDVVAHEVTVMTLQAEGARRRIAKTDPDVAEALATISDSGRKGLAEMQRMIGVLRTSERELEHEAATLTGRKRAPALVGTTDADDLAPMPSLAAIPALVKQVEDSGLPVRLAIAGTSHVPAGVELSAYRIIQESLTNALKYAGTGASATVTVRRRRDAVTVTVEDDGRGVISDVISSSGGNGLAGMKERVAALGGRIELGARQGGGFRVHAVLPVTDDQVMGQRTYADRRSR
ncbi:histidine kinase, partial [Demequina sp. TTPB684]